jgi:hypothetical protein
MAHEFENLMIPVTFSPNSHPPVGVQVDRGVGEFWVRQDTGAVWMYKSTGFATFGGGAGGVIVQGTGPSGPVSGPADTIVFDPSYYIDLVGTTATIGADSFEDMLNGADPPFDNTYSQTTDGSGNITQEKWVDGSAVTRKTIDYTYDLSNVVQTIVVKVYDAGGVLWGEMDSTLHYGGGGDLTSITSTRAL